MQKLIFIIILLLTCIPGFSQEPVEILIGKNDSTITIYYMKLNRLSANKSLAFDKFFSKDEDLILENKLPAQEEKIFNCVNIATLFLRVNGQELCVKQTIVGSTHYGDKKYQLSKR